MSDHYTPSLYELQELVSSPCESKNMSEIGSECESDPDDVEIAVMLSAEEDTCHWVEQFPGLKHRQHDKAFAWRRKTVLDLLPVGLFLGISRHYNTEGLSEDYPPEVKAYFLEKAEHFAGFMKKHCISLLQKGLKAMRREVRTGVFIEHDLLERECHQALEEIR